MNIYRMKNTTNPDYVVITKNSESLNSVRKKAKTLLLVVVKWEKLLNKKELIQCRKCQLWGHSTGNCFADIRCMWCAANHNTSECTIKTNNEINANKIKCANCGEKHPANSIECRVYIERHEYVSKKRPRMSSSKKLNQKKCIQAPKV